jgi:rhamnosyltransferase
MDISTQPARAAMNTKEVCAIVVTYHPDGGFPERIARIAAQVGALVIVDNGSDLAEVRMLRELTERSAEGPPGNSAENPPGNRTADPPITLVLNAENLGVARALNIGIERAGTLGFRWVLLLDQDSCVNPGLLEALFAVYASYPQRERLAVIGAGFRDVNRPSRDESPGVVSGAPPEACPWEEVESVITSGSLIPLAVHAEVGPFREEFFIDYVDSDYCFRARAKGFRVIKTRQTLMSHAIGAASEHSVLWMNKWTTNHSPDRRYYIARNDTVMLREYGHYAFGLWALKSFSRSFRLCKRILLYEQMKTLKVIAVIQGWWDGIRGHLGPRAHRPPRPC